jgi:hypothetical protein
MTEPLSLRLEVACSAEHDWRGRNRTGWSTLLPHFTAAAGSADPEPTH